LRRLEPVPQVPLRSILRETATPKLKIRKNRKELAGQTNGDFSLHNGNRRWFSPIFHNNFFKCFRSSVEIKIVKGQDKRVECFGELSYSQFCGNGSPWQMTVLSKATTAFFPNVKPSLNEGPEE
jgi:hypothetical protein